MDSPNGNINKENIEENSSKNLSIEENDNKIMLNTSKQEELLNSSKKSEKTDEDDDDNINLKNDSLKENQNNSDNKNSNKSTSVEKQDVSEEIIEPNEHNKNYNNLHKKNLFKNKIIKQKNKNKKNQEFDEYYSRMIDFQKKKEEKLIEKRKELENKEIKKLKPKPEISKRSKEIIINNKKENLFERMKEKEQKAKDKKNKLIEKIKNERAKKKEEQDKPLEFNTNLKPIDKKFNKIYLEMKKKELKRKEDFQVFAEVVKQYENRECVFQPNVYEDEEGQKKPKHRKLKSCDLIQRLYNDELKNRMKVKENLEQKYKLSFKPKINDTSIEMANRWKQKMKAKKGENANKNDTSGIGFSKVDKIRINNSAIKRKVKKFDIALKKSDKTGKDKINETEDNIKNKNEDNNYIYKIKTEIINENNDNITKDEGNKNKEENIEIKEKEKDNNENNENKEEIKIDASIKDNNTQDKIEN